jgi:hypothetical protein
MFVDQLADALAGVSTSAAIANTAAQHGADLLRKGFTVSQVVHEYGDVCQAITELAIEKDASISTIDFRMMSRCLDAAMAAAVTEYERPRERAE